MHNFVTGINHTTRAALPKYGFASHSGLDTNSLYNPDLCRKTIALAYHSMGSDETLVVGVGTYSPENIVPSGRRTMMADGPVILNGKSTKTLFSSQTTDGGTIRGFVIQNYKNLYKLEGAAGSYSVLDIQECLVFDAPIYCNHVRGFFINKSIFVGSDIEHLYSASNTSGNANSSIFIDLLFRCRSHVKNSYFNENSILHLATTNGASTSTYQQTNYNCYHPNAMVFVDGVEMTLAERQAMGFDLNSIVALPEFINPDIYNFSVTPTSPLLGAGENGINIGNVFLGTSFSQGVDNIDDAVAAHPNLAYNGLGELIILDPLNTTTAQQGVEELVLSPFEFDVVRYIGRVDLLGITNFTDNVPDIENVPNPNYLSYYLRWAGSGQDIQQAVYYPFRWGMIPTVIRDVNGNVTSSNGVSGFDFSLEKKIPAKYVQPKIVIKATGYYTQS